MDRRALAAIAMSALAIAGGPAYADEAPGGIFSGVRPELGPVRWGGTLATELRSQRSSGAGRSLTRLDLANVTAGSYVWQPWFAQLRGSLGALRSTGSGAGGSSSSSSLTGDAAVALFPVSRFPFDAHMSVSDSRASGELTSNDYRNKRWGARQGYRTADGTTSYSGRYERSTLTSSAFSTDVLDVLEASMNRRLGVHQVELNGNLSDNRGGAGGLHSRLARMNGRHAVNPASNLSVESLASHNSSTVRGTGADASEFASRATQFTTFGTWRPEEGDLLYEEGRTLLLTASGRLFTLASESGAAASDSNSINGSLGANYSLSPRTRLSASATATQTSAGGSETLFTAQSANLTYSPESRPLGAYTYSWSTTGGATNTTVTGGDAAQTYTAQGSHGLSRSLPLGAVSSLSFLVGQSAAAAYADQGNSWTLTHNAGAHFSSGNGSGGQTYVGVSGADARTFGVSRSEFQLANLQATRQNPLSSLSFWTGNLTVQGTRQRSAEQAAGAGFQWTTTGNVSYHHRRAFGIARLRFTGSYTASQQRLSSRAGGDIDAPRDFTSSSAEGRLDYYIGKLEIRLSARSAVVEERRESLVFLRLARNF
jgi:hypothetical protein